jgi:hypothetical protein
VSVACGADQAFTVHADDCYSIADVAVDGGSVGAVAGYTFANVHGTPHDRGDVQLQRPVHDRRLGGHGRHDRARRRRIGRLRHDQGFTISASDCYSIATSRSTAARSARSPATRSPTCTARTRSPATFSLNGPYTIDASAGTGRHDRAERRGVRGVRRRPGVHRKCG